MVQNERVLRDITAGTALAVIILGGTLLLVALLAELQRRRTAHSQFVLIADRLLPTGARRTAVALLTVLSAFTTVIAPPAASADTSVRDWLTDATTTSTQPAPKSAPTTLPQFVDRPTVIEPSGPPLTAPAPHGATPSTTAPITTPPLTSEPAVPRSAPIVHEPSSQSRNLADDATRHTQPAPAASSSVPNAPAPTSVPGPAVAMYRVVPGDCLWSIAARVLGSSASSSATDRGWRAIYAANRAAIGENPNLIYPGLLLTLPPLTAAS